MVRIQEICWPRPLRLERMDYINSRGSRTLNFTVRCQQLEGVVFVTMYATPIWSEAQAMYDDENWRNIRDGHPETLTSVDQDISLSFWFQSASALSIGSLANSYQILAVIPNPVAKWTLYF